VISARRDATLVRARDAGRSRDARGVGMTSGRARGWAAVYPKGTTTRGTRGTRGRRDDSTREDDGRDDDDDDDVCVIKKV